MTNGANDKQSLSQLHPRHFEIPILIFTATALLAFGLCLPLLNVEKMIFWKNSYSVITGIIGMAQDGEYLLAAILFFFSVLFPIFKLVALGGLWSVKLSNNQRGSILHWLELLGKWSMLDVFVVAILIVAAKLGPLANTEPKIGVYLFALAIFTSMIATTCISRLLPKNIRKV